MSAAPISALTPMEALHSWAMSFPPPRVAGKPVESRNGNYWLRTELEPEYRLRQTDVDQFDTCKALIHTLLIIDGINEAELAEFRQIVSGDNTIEFDYADLSGVIVAVTWAEGL